MNVLVTGVSGYIGSLLVPRLRRKGHDIRGMARHPERVADAGVPIFKADAVSGEGLDQAFEGVQVAYYLIHSMEHADADGFVDRDRLAAERFTAAATSAGVR